MSNNLNIIPHKSIWNTHHGCRKISAGCQNCYMYALDKMRNIETPSDIVRKLKTDFNLPLKKNKQGEYKIKSGEMLRVNMTSDTFIEEADIWRDELWDIIRKRPDVIFWLLTKRPERFKTSMPSDWNNGYPNVVINITCENQEMFNARINYLLELPAKHKGLCLTPLLSPINIAPALATGQIESVSAGGENYDNPRPCDYDWVRYESELCSLYHINFTFYETGTNFIYQNRLYHLPSKQKQSIAAFDTNLNRKFYDIKYDLKYPDGKPITPYERYFNLNHCICCSSQDTCNGCTLCGNCCGDKIMTDENNFKKYQEKLISEGIQTNADIKE